MADDNGIVKTIKRPYDNYLFYNGLFYAMELKIVKKFDPFNFNNLEKHQEENLLNVYENKGIGYIIINYRFNPDIKDIKKFNLLNRLYNFCIAIKIQDYIKIRKLLFAEKSKSIPKEIVQSCYEHFCNKKIYNESIIVIDNRYINGRIIWNVEKLL